MIKIIKKKGKERKRKKIGTAENKLQPRGN